MKLMALRYAGTCRACGCRVEQRARAWYDPASKTITCTACRPSENTPAMDLDQPEPTNMSAVPPTATRSGRTDLEKGAELEQRIAQLFTVHGYRVRTNVVQEGRSGASHEVDVLADKTDDLLAMSVAIECKAWANPIEKDVVAKVDHVRRDLGVGHALIVSLNGARPGATTLARDVGVIVWGPDEIQSHLGKASVLGLQHRPMVEEVGLPRAMASDAAVALIAKETSGRLGFGREDMVWSGDAWLPVGVVQLTLRKIGPFQRKAATTQAWCVYDLISGVFLARVEDEPERTPVQLDGPRLEPRAKPADCAKALQAVIAKWEKVTTDAAKQKYRTQMKGLGVPDWHTATPGTATHFLYPIHLAIARRNGGERVVVVDSFRGRLHERLGHNLSDHIASVRHSVGA